MRISFNSLLNYRTNNFEPIVFGTFPKSDWSFFETIEFIQNIINRQITDKMITFFLPFEAQRKLGQNTAAK